MWLVIAVLAFAVALGVSVERVGFGVYASLFLFAFLGSLVFLLLYRPGF